MLPSNQLAFSDFMVMPLYKMFANKFPECQPLLDQASANWRYWKAKSMDSIPRVLSLDMDEIVDAMERAQIPGTIVDDAVNHMVETVYKALSSFVRPGEEPPELTASVANKMRQESRRSKLGLLRTTTDLERMSMDMQAQVTGLAEQSGNNAETSGHTTPKSNLGNN
jgi:predicted transcriptional regulator